MLNYKSTASKIVTLVNTQINENQTQNVFLCVTREIKHISLCVNTPKDVCHQYFKRKLSSMPTWSTIGVWSSFPSKTWLTDVDHATKGLNNTHSPWQNEKGYSIGFGSSSKCQGIHVCLINLH